MEKLAILTAMGKGQPLTATRRGDMAGLGGLRWSKSHEDKCLYSFNKPNMPNLGDLSSPSASEAVFSGTEGGLGVLRGSKSPGGTCRSADWTKRPQCLGSEASEAVRGDRRRMLRLSSMLGSGTARASSAS
jgi:hypothetical protein